MESSKENSVVSSNDKEKIDASDKKVQKIVKKCGACVVSFLVSLAGGLTLAWWRCVYQPDNRELWMVPFGLILLATPVIVWLSVLFSYACSFKTNNDIISRPTEATSSLDESIPDPER